MAQDSSTDSGTPDVAYRDLLLDRVLVVVLLISVVGSLGSNIAAPAIPAIADAFTVTDSRAGLVITTFSLTAMFAVPITAVLADLYGRRPVVIPGVVGFGAIGTAIAFAPTFDVVLLLRALQGVAFAGTAPLVVVILGDLYEGPTGSAAQGIRSSVHGISSIVAPAVAGFAAGILWSYPFLLYAATIPVALLAYWYLPRHDPITEQADPALDILSIFGEYVQALRVEMATPGLTILLLGGIALFLVRVAVLTFVPLYAVGQLGASTFIAGTMLSIRGVVRIIVAPTVGTLTAWTSRGTMLVTSFAISTVGVALMGLADSIPLLGATVALYSLGLSICFPLLNDAVVNVPGEEYRAGVIGGFSMLKSGASTVSPVLFGAILAFSSYEVMFLIGGGISAIYTVSLFLRYTPLADEMA